MRLGIIGYANRQGLGIMTSDLIRIFNIEDHLIIPSDDKGTFPEISTATHKTISETWTPSDDVLRKFLSTIDAIITVETTYHPKLFQIAKEMGVRTIFLVMWEWFDWGRYIGADVYISTSQQSFRYLNETNNGFVDASRIVDLPWPIDTDRFGFRMRGQVNRTFIHNSGFGGMNWRKGTIEATEAFMSTKNSDIKLILRAQYDITTLPNYKSIVQDKRIKIYMEDFDDNVSMYDLGDVYLYPARYDGQALVAEEAMACGFPVFVTNASPMNEFSEDERFKIKLKEKQTIKIHDHDVDMNLCDIKDLAEKINWAANANLVEVSIENRRIIRYNYSWHKWKDKYSEVFNG